MKINLPKRFLSLFIITFLILTIISCESKIGFELTKEPEILSANNIENVISFGLRYNPKAYATIIINLSNGADYTAEQLGSTQTAAILHLLQEENLQFDTENKEFVLKPN